MIKNISISLISVILLSLPWLGFPGYSLLVAFVPILFLQHKLGKQAKILPYMIFIFLLWNIITVYWIKNATWVGVIASFAVNTSISTAAFMIYHYVWRRAKLALAYTVFVTAWITCEYIYLNGQISFPWLVLGNGFANSIKTIQWYEYTGTLGGSLWVLISNLIVFEAIKTYQKSRIVAVFIPSLLIIFIPIITSLLIYHNYKEVENRLKVEVIQPNFNPYSEKFMLSQDQQTNTILSLAKNAPKDVDFIVTPETSFENTIWEDGIDQNHTIKILRNFMNERYPDSKFIAGAVTYKMYENESESTLTSKKYGEDKYYDVFNAALQVDSSKIVDIYHKSKLVIGAETMPFNKQMKFLARYSLDLGGITGNFGTEKNRSVFSSKNGVKVGIPVCYESIYGEYCTEYVWRGAEALFIISNDGWWGDTPGHKQLFSYSKLRAIENRRSIARSANTGISGFINQRGDVISKTLWDERCSQYGEINLNKKITFYTVYGDYIGRLSSYILILCFLYFISYTYRKKHLLTK